MCGPDTAQMRRLAQILPNTKSRSVTLSADSDLKQVIASIPVPGLDKPISAVGRVLDAEMGGSTAKIALRLGFPSDGIRAELEDSIRAAISAEKLELSVETRVTAHGVQRNLKPLPGVRNIIAIASGKGGVGKSTTAANIALALASEGASVGVLDADIYGPSQPQMLGLSGESPTSADGKTMQPLVAHGVQVMSIGFLIDPDQPMVWRGPMVTSALNQLLNQTQWDDLDYLIVDMPPGTGDIQLTLSQQVPVSGCSTLARACRCFARFPCRYSASSRT
jgi:ATP-binding protein involved in chromosome partitioning